MFGFFRKPQLPRDVEQKIIQQIREAESGTSAEIRVHLNGPLKGKTPLEMAQLTFKKQGMHLTELRNGVLIFVSLKDRQFAIVGDSGIHQCVTDAFWNEVKSEMEQLFRNQGPGEAICHGVKRAGEKLKQYFPAGNVNPNELSDEISRS
ncbi:MAG: TPM domain-containing protein [Bacteroidetes bacterium]|nr:TPM domain-containing protein [Bacteroidota bacterium]MBS3914292.1 TPM domain-containing protein [Bacteroidota bacterium]